MEFLPQGVQIVKIV